ncbi:MAG: CPBP family intramembrane metalloprotease [Halanaerobiales bacterium]|nr:CPBP family intramembrane metalloprotease [Halanaerobiales bacterium]
MSVFWILWLSGLVGIITVQPYQVSLIKEGIGLYISKKNQRKLILATIVQAIILLTITTYFGIMLAPRVHLHWWILEYRLEGTALPFSINTFFIVSFGAGILATLLMLIFDLWLKKKISLSRKINVPTPLQSLCASVYGGITEEISVRLFFMSLIVYIANLIGITGQLAYWLGIFISAVLFGGFHLPAAIQLLGNTKIVWVRTFLLNGVSGIIFGWMFWKYGLEGAMLTHFVMDFFAHVILTPLLN